MLTVQWLSKQIGTLWIEPVIDTRSFANVATGIIENGVSQPSNILNVRPSYCNFFSLFLL